MPGAISSSLRLEQQHGAGGCPLGSLSSELSDDNAWAQEQLADSFTRWAEAIGTALNSLVENGTLRPDTDTRRLALALLAAVQGGLLLAQAQRTTDALAGGPGHRHPADPRPRDDPLALGSLSRLADSAIAPIRSTDV